MENGKMPEALNDTEDIGQGFGHRGKLWIVYRDLCVNCANILVITKDEGTGQINFVVDASGKAFSIECHQHPRVEELQEEFPEDNLVAAATFAAHSAIIRNLVKDNTMVMNLDHVLYSMERKQEEEPSRIVQPHGAV